MKPFSADARSIYSPRRGARARRQPYGSPAWPSAGSGGKSGHKSRRGTERAALRHVNSDGYAPVTVALDELEPVPAELETTAALVRGVAAAVTAQGYEVPGFDAYVVSTVLPGSGLSSSAAFEVLMGTVMNHLAGARLSAVKIAQLSKYAENVYFQQAQRVDGSDGVLCRQHRLHRLRECGQSRRSRQSLLISHPAVMPCASLTAARIMPISRMIMRRYRGSSALSAAFSAREHLREVDEAEFFSRLAEVRAAAGDRAALRAIHIFSDNRRVDAQVNALISEGFCRVSAPCVGIRTLIVDVSAKCHPRRWRFSIRSLPLHWR